MGCCVNLSGILHAMALLRPARIYKPVTAATGSVIEPAERSQEEDVLMDG